MKHRVCISLFAALLAAACGFAVSDDPKQDPADPPVRLKKKVRQEPAPENKDKKEFVGPLPRDKSEKKAEPGPKGAAKPKDEAQEKEDDAAAELEARAKELEAKIQELTDRINKNMKASEDRLAEQDPSEPTQQIQDQVRKDLEELMNLLRQQQDMQQQQQQQQGGTGGEQQQQQQGSMSRRQRRQMARRQRGRQRQMAQQQGEPDQMQGEQGNQAGRGGAGDQKRDPNKFADMIRDIWGHLPETTRQEMDQYSREQFMAKYNDLLKRYYSTLAEKGRRKGD